MDTKNRQVELEPTKEDSLGYIKNTHTQRKKFVPLSWFPTKQGSGSKYRGAHHIFALSGGILYAAPVYVCLSDGRENLSESDVTNYR